MKIEWLGMSCFKIQVKNGANEKIVLFEPFDQNITGLKLPRALSADILIRTPQNKIVVGENPFIIEGEGEYEYSGVFVYGISQFEKKEEKIVQKIVMYRVEAEDMSLVHLMNLNAPLDNGILEELKDVDILIVPIGGGDVLDEKQAEEVIHKIEPRVVIPSYYHVPGLSLKGRPLEGREKFIKAFSVSAASDTKLKITRKDLPEDKMEIKILDRA